MQSMHISKILHKEYNLTLIELIPLLQQTIGSKATNTSSEYALLTSED